MPVAGVDPTVVHSHGRIVHSHGRVALRSPESSAEWARVATMMAEYFAWLAASADLDHVADAQPGADEELADLRRCFVGPDRELVVAWDGATPLGTAGIVGHDDGTAELVRVYTRPGARGSGLGTALVRHAMSRAEAMGFASVHLETSTHFMGDAIRIYERLGFERVTETPTITVDGVVRFRRGL